MSTKMINIPANNPVEQFRQTLGRIYLFVTCPFHAAIVESPLRKPIDKAL